MTDAANQGGVSHSPRLFQLDALRGIAAMVIMLFHLDLVYRIHGPFVRGYLFVDMFFLLSGFVLAVSTERKLNAGIGALAFTRDRFIRLWPLVAVGAGVAVARAFAIGMADPLTLLLWLALDLAMIPNLTGTGSFYRFNGPQWTLFYELLANFLHALVLRKVPTRWMLALAIALGVALIVTVLRSWLKQIIRTSSLPAPIVMVRILNLFSIPAATLATSAYPLSACSQGGSTR